MATPNLCIIQVTENSLGFEWPRNDLRDWASGLLEGGAAKASQRYLKFRTWGFLGGVNTGPGRQPREGIAPCRTPRHSLCVFLPGLAPRASINHSFPFLREALCCAAISTNNILRVSGLVSRLFRRLRSEKVAPSGQLKTNDLSNIDNFLSMLWRQAPKTPLIWLCGFGVGGV